MNRIIVTVVAGLVLLAAPAAAHAAPVDPTGTDAPTTTAPYVPCNPGEACAPCYGPSGFVCPPAAPPATGPLDVEPNEVSPPQYVQPELPSPDQVAACDALDADPVQSLDATIGWHWICVPRHPQTITASAVLPRTGGDSSALAGLAILLCTAGVVMCVTSRRLRSASTG